MTDAGAPDGAASADRRDRRWAWAVGAVAALLVVGPGLGPGAWLNVDLVVTDVTPVPRGVWGMGPELPRRVPFALPFAWLSALVPGTLPWKLAVVAALASGVAGTWRLTTRWGPDTAPVVRAGAGLVAGVGPFATTRTGAGHLGLVFALAALPWALPALLRPLDRPTRAVGWALVLGAAGPFGGTLALPALACGLVADRCWRPGRRRPAALVAGGALVAQGPWLVPTLVVARLGTDIASAGAFPTDLAGPGGPLRLLLGHGFWRTPSQIGGAQGWEVAVAGAVLAALAVVGWTRLPSRVRAPAGAVGVLGLVVAASSAVPGLDDLVARLVDVPPFAALREGQRALALWLVVAAPAAAVGADHLARRWRGVPAALVGVAPLVVGVVAVGPGLWGVGGALRPVDLPPGWAEVRREVEAASGPVLALPWQSYPRLEVSGGRPAAQPLAVFLGGDVLTSSDPGFGDGSRERSDRREPRAAALAERMGDDEPVASELADLGVRWVVEVRVAGRPLRGVPDDPGLRPVVTTPDITLHEVRGWAPARDEDGQPVPVDRPVAPWLRTADGPVEMAAPGTTGWRRDGRGSRSADGLLALPDGSGAAWYPGAALTLAADGAAAVVAAGCLVGPRRRRRRSPAATAGGRTARSGG